MEGKTIQDIFGDIYNFDEEHQTIDSGKYITVHKWADDNRIFYSAKDQEWSKKAREELWAKHNIIMNNGVVGIKVNGNIITLGIEDDGTVAFDNDSMCFHVYWVDALIDALQEAKQRILEGV